MTAAQRATLEGLALRYVNGPHAILTYAEYDALRAALGTCGTCAHADTTETTDGWCFCAAPSALNRFHDPAFPFRYRLMPVGERCTGYTPKEGA